QHQPPAGAHRPASRRDPQLHGADQPAGQAHDRGRGRSRGTLPVRRGGAGDHGAGDRHRRRRDPGVTGMSPEQAALGERARQIAHEALRPLAAAGTPGRVNRPLVRALAEHGLLPGLFPQRVGGTNPGEVAAVDLCLVREALAHESTEAENALAIQALGAHPIVQAGNPELVRRWVPPVASGEAVAAFALTEPEAGSDAGSLALNAERDGNAFRLSGEKSFISNAPDADVYVVFARTTPDAGSKGITAFVVPGDAPGLSGKAIRLVSPHPVGRLEFDGVPVDAGQVVGEVDH